MTSPSRSGFLWALGLVGCVTSGLGAAQQPSPTFRSTVTLVTVDVSVLDKQGRPVPGLTAGDFEVKLNGRVRPVRVLTYVQAAGELAPSAAAVVPAQPGAAAGVRRGRQTVTNEGVVAAAQQAGEDRVFVLLIDDLSFAPLRGKALFLAAKRFVDGLPAVDVVGIATTSGSAAVNPTPDRAAIRAVLDRAAGESSDPQSLAPAGHTVEAADLSDADGSVGISQAIEIERGDLDVLKVAIAQGCFNGDRSQVDSQLIDVLIALNTCASQVQRQARTIASATRQTTRRQVGSFGSVIDAMRAATGLKHLVVLSDGLAIGRDGSQLTAVARAAATAGVQVSVLMEERDLSLVDTGRRSLTAPTGTTNTRPSPQSDTGAPQRRIEDNKMFLAGGQLLAEMAGGQFHRIIGQPDPFFGRVRAASAAVYRLGLEPSPDVDSSRIVNVEAKVNRRDVLVHANRHGVGPASAALAAVEPTVDDRLRAAISRGQSHGAVPLRLATALRRSSTSPSFDLSVSAEVPGSAKRPVVTMFGLTRVPAPGEPLAEMTSGRREIAAPDADGPFRLSVSLPATAGSYLLRLAVADATGALGAVEVPVDVTLNPMGPVVASDLVTAWVDAAGQAHLTATDDLPVSASSVQAMLELYAPPSSAPGVIETLKDHLQVEFTLTRTGEPEPMDERAVVPQLIGGVLRALAEYGVDDWQPGTYRFVVRVRWRGQVVGTTLATIKKR